MTEEIPPDELLAKQAEEQPTEAEGYDLGEPPAPEPEREIHAAVTAFLVVIDETGSAIATSDVNIPLALQREATAGDFYRACAEIQKDIEGMETAHRVQQVMLATSQAVMKAQQEEQERARVAQILQQGIHRRG